MNLREFARWEWRSILLWMTFGAINGTQVVVGMRAQGMQHPWSRLFLMQALSWAVWAVGSPVVYALGKAWTSPDSWKRHTFTFLLISSADAAWTGFLGVSLQPMGHLVDGSLFNSMLGFFYSKLHLDAIVYLAILGLARLVESGRIVTESRLILAEREEQLAKARLEALRRQLQPHFLFNCLNGISGLIRSGESGKAVKMIAGLSDLLRRVIDGRNEAMSTLSEEIALSRKYIELQEMRFADRLRHEIDVPDQLVDYVVPTMILQPLIENALEHGIGKRANGGGLFIRARSESGRLVLTIVNDGPLIGAVTEGVGISNTRLRLRNLYGDNASFRIDSQQPQTVRVEVAIPLRG